MAPSDEDLMAAYAEGDIEAFERLYERHKGRVLGYLFSRLRDRDEAEEVFQAVFTKLHLGRRRYRREIPFLPWLFTIARNALIDHTRKSRTYRRHIVITEEIVAPDTSHGTKSLQIGSAIAEISTLSPTQRQALELRYDQGFSFDEIAAQMKTSAANARQLISRAVRRLRAILNDKGAR